MTTLLTLAQSVATHARTQPHKTGARDSKRSLSYAEWDARASRLANALLSLGLQPGDRVALLAYNCVEWLEIYTALARAGLVAVPINFRLKGPEVAYIVQHAEAQAFICQEELRALVDGIRDELPIAPARYLHFGTATAPTGWHGYEALIDAASGDAAAVEVKPKDLFALMYTSGTTGRPKGAMRSHEGNALIALVTALEFGLTREDTGLLVMPLCHANSLYFSVTFAMLGATIVVDDRRSFDPEAVLRTLARERVTFTSLVPTHYIMMLDLPDVAKQGLDLHRVDKLLISSAPARKDTKLAILQLFPNGRLFELYGSTEAGWVTILRPDEQLDHLGSVGREWAGSGPIRLLDTDGHEVPDGEVGELYSRTAYAFDGYWKNPEKTSEAFSGPWCSVGDMARRDAQGFVHLVDRKSNTIISGGENIYPSEVESVLAAHPAVQDVAVVGLTDAKWGEAVHAVIVLRPGQTADAKTMEDWCRERMAGFKRPRGYRFVAESELPRTATGKIQHRVLRDRMTSVMTTEAA
jgi:acyl-CoA synthetase (AMP-forming)/AMP-acid ligase II